MKIIRKLLTAVTFNEHVEEIYNKLIRNIIQYCTLCIVAKVQSARIEWSVIVKCSLLSLMTHQ